MRDSMTLRVLLVWLLGNAEPRDSKVDALSRQACFRPGLANGAPCLSSPQAGLRPALPA